MRDPTEQLDASERHREQNAPRKRRNVIDIRAAAGKLRSRPIMLLIASGVALIAAIVIATMATIFNLRDRALADSETELRNLALVLAEQTDRSFQAVELVQQSLIDRMHILGISTGADYERQMSGNDTHLLLKGIISGLPQLDAVTMINPQGKLINFSRYWPIPAVNVSDRDYFKALKSDANLTSFISKPVQNRGTGTWTIYIARRFSGPNGEFLGLVLGAMELRYFEEFYKKVSLGPEGNISLIRRDGMLLARHPNIAASIGKSLASNPLFASLISKANSRAVRITSGVDGQDRLIAAHTLPNYPIVVAVGTTVTAALANWRSSALYMTGFAALLAIVVGGIVFLSGRQIAKKLQAKNAQLDSALSNMSQGLIMFDSAAQMVVCNDRYREMCKLPPDLAKPGCTLLDILKYRAANGTFFGNPEEYARDLLAAIVKGKAESREIKTDDGRIISVVNQPMAGGGWVATHEDITERKRAEAELHKVQNFLDTVVENVPLPIVVKSVPEVIEETGEYRFTLINRAAEELFKISRDQMIGKNAHEVYAKDHADFVVGQDIEALRTNGAIEVREHTVEKSGHEVRFVTSRKIAVRDDKGKPKHLLSLLEDVTERKRAGDELRRTKASLDTALENMSQGLCLFDVTQCLIVCNNRYAELYGLTPEQTKPGTTLREILEHRVARGTAPHEKEKYITDRINEVTLNKSYQIVNRLNDGRYISVVHKPLAKGGWVATHEDVTEAKRREESFRLLFESNPVPMWVIARESLRFLAVNDAVINRYGYSREQLMSMTALDIRPVEDREQFAQFLPRESSDLLTETISRHSKADGTIIDVRVYSRALIYADQNARLAAILDVTDRKRAADELQRTKMFLDTVIEHVPDALFVKEVPNLTQDGRNLRFTLINRAGEELFGAPRQQIIGKTTEELFPKDRADFIAEHDIATLNSNKPLLSRDHYLVTPGNGTRVVTAKTVAIRNNKGEPRHILVALEDVTERRRAEQRIVHMAHYDTLTDMPNRATFNETLDATVDQAKAANKQFAVLSIDLDRFKEANDAYGHLVGDRLLCEIASRLRRAAGEAFIARIGGDEFVLIVTEDEQPAAATKLARRLLAIFADDFVVEGHRLKLGTSIGIAIYPIDGAESKTLMNNADVALYRAKAEARGTALFYEPEMGARLRERHAMQEDLRSAIANDELLLHYQPQMKMSGEPIGFEALVRWQCPKRGTISPGKFIPVAEESGLIIQLSEWVLREACREAASWPQPLTIAVNISPMEFRHGDLPRLVHSILLETGLTPARLELEITESVMVRDFSHAVSIINRLKSLGVKIAMDDFGTGYSSLSYLHSFRCDKIKIDRIFVCDLEQNHHSRSIVRAVIGLGRSLNLPILAEGVETEAQHAFLVLEGCDEMQGYLSGRPLPIADYAELVGRHSHARQNIAVAG